MAMHSSSAKELAALGVNIEITPNTGYHSDAVKDIINIVVANDRHITIHAKDYNSLVLAEMAKIGGGNLTIKI